MNTPENIARTTIDKKLENSGWAVQDHKAMNIYASKGVAIRNFPLKRGFADYLLYADGKAIGVVEAKKEGYTLTGVEIQSTKYSDELPKGLPHFHIPLPFVYESTGTITQFTNRLDPDPRSRDVFTFHRPEELIRLAKLGNSQLRAKLKEMPELSTSGLWNAQIEAIANLEASLAKTRPRALIQMATGSGKTFTACTFSYRLIKFAKAKRILFLVDRNTLGNQASNEFQQFQSNYSEYKFTEEFNVQHLKKNVIDPACKVTITTVQRLYSILKGEDEFADENEQVSLFETESPLIKEPLPVVYNPNIPIETFDFIIVDECHRSIYNLWRQVLEYFDAFIIGLTATPTPQTIGFFNGNLVQDYSHERAVADGVNVGYDVYRIQTRVSRTGATLEREPGFMVPFRDKRTKEKKLRELENDLTYTANQLDRDVVSESQIRLVIQTFRDRLFTDIFPGRSEVPKTLVFAKSDLHADDIVKVIREEFGRGNDFCQKITYRTTGETPEDLIKKFRNSFNPRIAVTVDMIATGTDVKPLECLLFMRNINSASYFEQMKGRGSRVITKDDLQGVTPDAEKTHFVIVDAVGVCDSDKSPSKPLDRKPSVPLEKLLQIIAQGQVHEDIVSTLASRLARLDRQMDEEQEIQIASEADGRSVKTLISGLLNSIDPDRNIAKAREMNELKPDESPTDEQMRDAEHESMREALKPFTNPKLREVIIEIKSSFEQVIDEATQDELLVAGFDEIARQKAKDKINDFKEFIKTHKDEIEAIKILYSTPYRSGLKFKDVKELYEALKKPPLSMNKPVKTLWHYFAEVEPKKVAGYGGDSVTDLIELVRHALNPDEPLVPIMQKVDSNFKLWLSEKEKDGTKFSTEQMKWLTAIKNHIATSVNIEQDDFYDIPFSQMGGLGKAHTLFGKQMTTILDEMNRRLVA